MGRLVIHQEKVTDPQALVSVCPFGAISADDNGKIDISAACKMCKMCVKKGNGAVTFEEDAADKKPKVDKSKWSGITVYVDHVDGKIHPVTYELIGKAREMADKINHPVYALFIGADIEKQAEELLHYGVDEVFVYDYKELKRFKMEPYTNVFEDFVKKHMPTAILVGATTVGRQLAPRLAARLKTGLTADCTILDIDQNTDLSQIRPAFGGNIMAHILTPNNRPQLATVRYKVMNAPERSAEASGEIKKETISADKLKSNETVIDVVAKEQEKYIDSSDVLVVAGRGIKKAEDLQMLEELAAGLDGMVACTRPLIESGWMDGKRQIGLSGRTVRPKLIITCGVSGAIQFVAGMDHSETIVSINTDPKAPIFKVADYCLVGDLYEIIPTLLEKVNAAKASKEEKLA